MTSSRDNNTSDHRNTAHLDGDTLNCSTDDNTNDYSMTVGKDTEFDGIDSEIGKQIISDQNKNKDGKLTTQNRDYFFTNYNDLVANNFGLIFDLRV